MDINGHFSAPKLRSFHSKNPFPVGGYDFSDPRIKNRIQTDSTNWRPWTGPGAPTGTGARKATQFLVPPKKSVKQQEKVPGRRSPAFQTNKNSIIPIFLKSHVTNFLEGKRPPIQQQSPMFCYFCGDTQAFFLTRCNLSEQCPKSSMIHKTTKLVEIKLGLPQRPALQMIKAHKTSEATAQGPNI